MNRDMESKERVAKVYLFFFLVVLFSVWFCFDARLKTDVEIVVRVE